MSVKIALCGWLAAALCELVTARVLDELGLIEGLLSPSGASLATLLPLAIVFFTARFVVWFVAPGLALGALVVSFRPSAGRRD